MVVHKDCRHYLGDRPCLPHKQSAVHCEGCPHYQTRGARYCVIKLGAIGDVLRTTPLLRRIRRDDPWAKIYWVSLTPEVLPSQVDYPMRVSVESTLVLEETAFDYLFSLDKDPEACALANRIRARTQEGFAWQDGACAPIDEDARPKWLTGLFDDLYRDNRKSYPQEIFEICGYSFAGEQYLLELRDPAPWNGLPGGRPLIGLNTGCGPRWHTRLWPERHWEGLARQLKQAGYGVLLLGGELEDAKNRRIAESSGADYLGTFPLQRFFSLIGQCDLVVTAVSLALHVALGLGKKVVLFNNIFNPHEFEMYGQGVILEPEGYPCTGCFKTKCDQPCMESVKPARVLDAIRDLCPRGT